LVNKFSLQLTSRVVDCYFSINRKAKKILLKPQKDNTVIVVIPSTRCVPQAKDFVQEKKLWIEDALTRLSSIKYNYYYGGEEIKIDRHVGISESSAEFEFRNNILFIDAPEKVDTVLLYEAWLKIMAKKVLPQKVVEISSKYNFNPQKIGVREAKTRWGSCSSHNHISLNSKLMMCDEKIIDYVIIHELCHTIHHNHSGKFWQLVAQVMPDYKTHIKRLKKYRL